MSQQPMNRHAVSDQPMPVQPMPPQPMLAQPMRRRRARLAAVLLVAIFTLVACGGDPESSSVPVDDSGFPIDWPIAIPPGNVNDCDNGSVSQQDALFTVVMCLPADPNPFTASESYLATLEGDGFVEREPGAFIVQQETFLDGNGIEVYFQLIDAEATVILIKPGG